MNINETTLRDIYNIGNKEVKERMEKEYPSLFKKQTLLEEAIEYLTENDEEVIKLRKFEKCLDEDDNILAEQKLIVIFKHKNDRHIFNWDNDDEYKYFSWWWLQSDDFRLRDVDRFHSISVCSPRLGLKSRELAENLLKEEEIINYFKLYLIVYNYEKLTFTLSV